MTPEFQNNLLEAGKRMAKASRNIIEYQREEAKFRALVSKAVDIEKVNYLHKIWMESWALAVQGLETENFAQELIAKGHVLGDKLGLKHYE